MSKKQFVSVIDSETDPFKFDRIPKPFLWGYLNEDGELQYFEKTDSLISFIEGLPEQIIYAHNGGRFDFHFIFSNVSNRSNVRIINGRIAEFKIGKCLLRDSYLLIPQALASYNKKEIDYELFEAEKRYEPRVWQEIKSYLYYDLYYLLELILEFRDSIGLSLTIASAALRNWRKISKEKTPKTSKAYQDKIKPYYYGGRVQCFKKGIINHPIKIIDVNSAYPYAMLGYHPKALTKSEPIISKSLPDKNIERAFITLECEANGCFPIRDKTGLHFPIGKGTFNITGHEFVKAQDLGLVKNVKIDKVLRLSSKIKFDEYINHWYDIKKTSKKGTATYIRAKLMMTNLYGKFATDPENYADYIALLFELHKQATMEGWEVVCEITEDMGLYERDISEASAHYYDMAISASITGAQRALMMEALHKVATPLYCDTDSIACYDTGDLKLGNELGEWDLEFEAIEGAIAGKKMYAFKDAKNNYKTACKGARLSPNKIYDIACGAEIYYENPVPSFSFKKTSKDIEAGKRFITRKIRST